MRDRLEAQLAVVRLWVGAPAPGPERVDGAVTERWGNASARAHVATGSNDAKVALRAKAPESTHWPRQAAAAEQRQAPRATPGDAGTEPGRFASLVRNEQRRIAARWTPSPAPTQPITGERSSESREPEHGQTQPEYGSSPAAGMHAASHELSFSRPEERAVGRAKGEAPVLRGATQRFGVATSAAVARGAAPARLPAPQAAHAGAALFAPAFQLVPGEVRRARDAALDGPCPEDVPPLPLPASATTPDLDLDWVEEALADRLELAALELGVELS